MADVHFRVPSSGIVAKRECAGVLRTLRIRVGSKNVWSNFNKYCRKSVN